MAPYNVGMLAILVLALSLPGPGAGPDTDFDRPMKEEQTALESPWIRDMMTAAMALPYGVTRMPCRARELQPQRGWAPAREPSGKISWMPGPEAKARWSGIYGTCYIESPVPRDRLGEAQRTALECECNGWLPKGISEYPLP
jgi:hypothetical protein